MLYCRAWAKLTASPLWKLSLTPSLEGADTGKAAHQLSNSLIAVFVKATAWALVERVLSYA